jgi:hypothetical protein
MVKTIIKKVEIHFTKIFPSGKQEAQGEVTHGFNCQDCGTFNEPKIDIRQGDGTSVEYKCKKPVCSSVGKTHGISIHSSF